MILRRISLALLMLAVGWPAYFGAQTATGSAPAKKRPVAVRKKRSAAKPTPTPVPSPTPIPTPLPLEQMPPSAPQVSFQNGQLSIQSTNSTLAAILRAVGTRVGATVELPPGAGSERVATHLGPGTPHDVLSTLLTNSRFDYVLAGLPGNPESVSKIVLTARSGGPSGSGGSSAPAGPAPRGRPQPAEEIEEQFPPDQEIPDQEIPDEPDANSADQPMPIEPQPPDTAAPPPEGGQADPNQPKTPEQLLQELQRMQQQQQQQQQQRQQQ